MAQKLWGFSFVGQSKDNTMILPKQHIIGTCKECIHRSPSGHCENDTHLVPDDEAYGSFDDSRALIVQAQAPIDGVAFWVGPDFGCAHWEHRGFN